MNVKLGNEVYMNNTAEVLSIVAFDLDLEFSRLTPEVTMCSLPTCQGTDAEQAQPTNLTFLSCLSAR